MELVCVLFFFIACSPGYLHAGGLSMVVPDEVTGESGKDAVLPCTFKAPSVHEQESMTVIWRIQKHFTGPVIFKCLSNTNVAETGQNCSESHRRYSLLGNPRSNNISLWIKNISFVDERRYFCRIQLSKSGSYETQTGTRLNIQVTPELQSIYIRTLASGEQFVTCDVKGSPPPTVTWVTPENISAFSASVQRTCCSASSSIVYEANTNYTCQIHEQGGLQQKTIYYHPATEQKCQISLPLFIVSVSLSTVFFIILVILAVFYIKGSSRFVETKHQHRANEPFQKYEDIYANV